MSGHSKWATIKHKKAATDAKRGKAFTKDHSRNDHRRAHRRRRSGNQSRACAPPSLRPKTKTCPTTISSAPSSAARATLEGETLEEVTFEGYGPGGVGMLVQVGHHATATASSAKFATCLPSTAATWPRPARWDGCFSRKGEIVRSQGAGRRRQDDVAWCWMPAPKIFDDDGSAWEVVTPPEAFEKVREALTKAGITPASAEVGWVPQNYVKLTGSPGAANVALIETMEDHDDVQHVYANFDIDEKEIQAVVAQASSSSVTLSPRRQYNYPRGVGSAPYTRREICAALHANGHTRMPSRAGRGPRRRRRHRIRCHRKRRPRAPRCCASARCEMSRDARTVLRNVCAKFTRLIVGLLEEFHPHAMAMESVFAALNVRTALKLAEVRGVVLLAAAQAGVPAHQLFAARSESQRHWLRRRVQGANAANDARAVLGMREMSGTGRRRRRAWPWRCATRSWRNFRTVFRIRKRKRRLPEPTTQHAPAARENRRRASP